MGRGVTRWVVATLAGMRLGNSETKADRFRSGIEKSPVCECGFDETRAHYWLGCSLHARERRELQRSISWALRRDVISNIGTLLGFGHRNNKVNADIKKAVIKFLKDTGRFRPE